MTLKLKHPALLTLAICSLLYSCEEKADPVLESYPMNPGTRWTYRHEIILGLVNGDQTIRTDTIITSEIIRIEKDTVLNDTMPVTRFSSHTGSGQRISSQYYFQDTEGLKIYAYDGSGNALPKASPDYSSDFLELIYLAEGINLNQARLYIAEPPLWSLKLPLVENSRWTYRNIELGLNLRIDKVVSGTEVLHLAGKAFDCFRLRYIYSGNSMYENTYVTEWYSESGLIKRKLIIGPIELTDETGMSLGTGSQQMTTEITNLQIY